MQSESQNIEFKESWRDEYLKWICGFANAQGGCIYIGINDDKEIVGVRDAKRLMEDIPNKVRDVLGIVVDVNLLSKEGKDYLEIIVEPCSVPISYHGQYHYRSGSTKQELKGVALQQFILKKMGLQWDDIPHETATIESLDERAVRYLLRKGIEAGRITDESMGDTIEEVLQNLGLITDNGKIKNAAVLLFGKRPQRYFTGVQFKIGRFGADETDLMFQDIIEGNILQMADEVIHVLKAKYLISPIHYEGMQRKEPLEIPEAAFREIIYNAIIHKQYGGAPIQMRVYADHIELWNEGLLPDGYTIETLLRKHSSRPRNLNIAEAFYRAGFIESWGRGIKKICDGFIAEGLPAPSFQEDCGGLLVTIPRRTLINGTLNGTLNQTQSKTLEFIRNNQGTNAQTVIDELGIPRDTLNKVLKYLIKEGYVERRGSKKTGGYFVTAK